MHRYEDLLHKDRQILAFDPLGAGRIAEVFGDLGKAQRVSVVVPGVDTDVLNFQRTDREFSAPVGMARSLYLEERAASASTRTAVIAWADYTAPSGLGMDAATGVRAVMFTLTTSANPEVATPRMPQAIANANRNLEPGTRNLERYNTLISTPPSRRGPAPSSSRPR